MAWQDTAVVLAHFHPHGRLERHLTEFVEFLASRTGRIVFVSTGLRQQGARYLEGRVRLIVRENVGYDFWSYRVGIDALGDLRSFRRLWILNSSFLILDPERLCSRLLDEDHTGDLIGITMSNEHLPHVQSYSVVFQGARVIQSHAFSSWWSQMVPISDRIQVILRYELGMSRHFGSAGFGLGSAFAVSRREALQALLRSIDARKLRIPPGGQGTFYLDVSQGFALNATHYCCERLLAELGIVKLDLVRSNPHKLDLRDLLVELKGDPHHRELYEDALSDR
jgi:lipopolysaccharide biosynthesis protein